MAEEEFRILAGALALGRFTATELVHTTGVKRNTVGSWLRRNVNYIQKEKSEAAERLPGPGRPPVVWRIRDGAAPKIRAVLDSLYPEFVRVSSADLRDGGKCLRSLDLAEAQVNAWRATNSYRDFSVEQPELIAARSYIKIAWEDFAELHAAGLEVSEKHLLHLAQMECEVGIGNLPASRSLPSLAIWLARRLKLMSDRGVPFQFAARTIRARAQVRSSTDRVALTAAALAAPVWSDEGLADDGEVEVAALNRCVTVADIVPHSQLLREIDLALDQRPTYCFCVNPEESQAILLGLVTRPGACRLPEVRDWLSHLPLSNDWRPELAPAVLRGLVNAPGINLHPLLKILTDPLRAVLNTSQTSQWRLGAIRKAAFDYSRRLMESHISAPSEASTSSLENVLAIYGWRPEESSSNRADEVLQ
jgi:hypothetical protein